MVNQSSLKNKPPSKVIAYVRDAIKRRYPKNRVTAGRLAVTVSYADKTELQILPAIRTTDGFRIAEPGSNKWSNVIHPRTLRRQTHQSQQRVWGESRTHNQAREGHGGLLHQGFQQEDLRIPHGVASHRRLRGVRGGA